MTAGSGTTHRSSGQASAQRTVAGVTATNLVNRRRPGAHDERPVEQLIPTAVIGHPVQLGDGERAAGGGPGLGDRHDTHGAPFCA